MSLKPIILHGHTGGPNPWKVALLLEELQIPYEHKFWDFTDLHTPKFEKYNPNGRTPAIEDPNTGITLWESGAILEYLIAEYDKEHKFSYGSTPEKYYLQQWLHFQMSGQGPYFGQRVWFTRYHADKIQSAVDRYSNEIRRILGVIDAHLKTAGTEYLVGNKYTYADLSFIPWCFLIPFIFGDESDEFLGKVEKELPHYWAWWQKVSEREVTKKVFKAREEAFAKQH